MNAVNSVGIYIHVPFCRSKCPYCDFYSVEATEQLMDLYTDETTRRIRALAPKNLRADTVYFGGGTPSLLGGRRMARIMDELRASVAISESAEITAEANPSSDLEEFLRVCAASGVNRLSLGMQSAVQRELAAIGRRHSPYDVKRAIENARQYGIDNISLDLMLGIPFQTTDSLEETLRFISECDPAHVSAYMLKIEEGTPFSRMKNTLAIADDDGLADLYELAFSRLHEMGFVRYEISNACKPGFESRHNLKYWNCEEYISFGPSAHGFFDGRRYYFDRSLASYLAGTSPHDDGEGGGMEEYVMLRLRLAQGLTEEGLNRRFGVTIPPAIRKRAASPLMKPYCVCGDEGISLTGKGMLVSNAIICDLIELL